MRFLIPALLVLVAIGALLVTHVDAHRHEAVGERRAAARAALADVEAGEMSDPASFQQRCGRAEIVWSFPNAPKRGLESPFLEYDGGRVMVVFEPQSRAERPKYTVSFWRSYVNRTQMDALEALEAIDCRPRKDEQ